MSETPRLSLIIPVYNDETHVKALLESLLSDPAFAVEVIAINDASTDNSLAQLQAFAQRDQRLTVLSHSHNQGLAATRNTGIAAATGEWLAFIDSDDWATPEALTRWLQYATDNQLELLIGNCYRFKSTPDELTPPTPIFARQPWHQILTGKEWIMHSVQVNEWPHYQWLQLARRELIIGNQLRLIENTVHEDILWTTQLALVANRIGFLPEPVYGYRVNPVSITRSPSAAAISKRATSYLFIMEKLASIAAELPRTPPVQQALHTQINRETGHLLGILRKKLNDKASRTRLARGYFQAGLHGKLVKGVRNPSDLWRAIRALLYLSYYAAT